MIRRIVGIETEFGVTGVAAGGGRSLGPDEIARYLFRPVVARSRSSNVFLTNGSRLYLDVGSHPEYATAECDGLRQLVAHDRAGERIVDELARTAETSLAEEGIDARVYLFKNNTDSAGNSYGCHENYLLDRSTQVRGLATELLPFLVSRQLICGAGHILPSPDAQPGSTEIGSGPVYCFSQRAEHLWDGVSSATTRSRPLINTRDEPHADSTRFRRMHVIAGDSNMIETTTLLKVGATRLVLEMLEAGTAPAAMPVSHPVRAIREIGRDLTGRRPVTLADGRTISALDIQREYLAAARAHVERGGGGRDEDRRDEPESTARVLELWGRVLDAVESGDHAAVAGEIDWAAKLQLIRRVQERTGCDLDHPRLAQIDLTFHDIRPGRGLYSLLERRGMVARVVSDAEIDAAVTAPPATTRAALRGRFVDAAQRAGRDFTVDWVHLKPADGAVPPVALTDPFVSEDERVDQLIERL